MTWIFEAIMNWWDPLPQYRDVPNLVGKRITLDWIAAHGPWSGGVNTELPRRGDIVTILDDDSMSTYVTKQKMGRVVGYKYYENRMVSQVVLDNGDTALLAYCRRLKDHPRIWINY